MSVEKICAKLVAKLVSMVGSRVKDHLERKDMEKMVHAAFSRNPQNLLALCADQKFCQQIFRLAKLEPIDAIDLVDLGCDVSEERKYGLSRIEIIEELRQFCNVLEYLCAKTKYKAGDMPYAVTTFCHWTRELRLHPDPLPTVVSSLITYLYTNKDKARWLCENCNLQDFYGSNNNAEFYNKLAHHVREKVRWAYEGEDEFASIGLEELSGWYSLVLESAAGNNYLKRLEKWLDIYGCGERKIKDAAKISFTIKVCEKYLQSNQEPLDS